MHPIHFLYGHLHDSIRTELDNLSNWVLALEADNEQDLQQRLQHLKERYHFLEQVYKYHSSVEDEVRRGRFQGLLFWRCGPADCSWSTLMRHCCCLPTLCVHRWCIPRWTPRSRM